MCDYTDVSSAGARPTQIHRNTVCFLVVKRLEHTLSAGDGFLFIGIVARKESPLANKFRLTIVNRQSTVPFALFYHFISAITKVAFLQHIAKYAQQAIK